MKLFFQIWATIILVIAGIIGVGFPASWACQQLPWLDDVLTGLLLLAMTQRTVRLEERPHILLKGEGGLIGVDHRRESDEANQSDSFHIETIPLPL